MNEKPSHKRGFFREHSLSITSAAVLAVWISLYRVSDPATHMGSFFGNAIADWTGLLVMVLATKYLYEKGPRRAGARRKTQFLQCWSACAIIR